MKDLLYIVGIILAVIAGYCLCKLTTPEYKFVPSTPIVTDRIVYDTIPINVDCDTVKKHFYKTSHSVQTFTNGREHLKIGATVSRNEIVGFDVPEFTPIKLSKVDKSDKNKFKMYAGLQATLNPVTFAPLVGITYGRFQFTSSYEPFSKEWNISGAYLIHIK